MFSVCLSRSPPGFLLSIYYLSASLLAFPTSFMYALLYSIKPQRLLLGSPAAFDLQKPFSALFLIIVLMIITI